MNNGFMIIAGDLSGDLLAAELVRALKCHPALHSRPFPLAFYGAGGPNMKAEGVEQIVDLTRHSIIGLVEALKKLAYFKRVLDQLARVAFERQPDAIICVDFSGFNRRLARAIRTRIRRNQGSFNNWRPRIVQYVSPQVWGSRPGRAYDLARDFDLLLSIFPFEKEWYARRVPALRVEFVGHPIVDRHRRAQRNPPLRQVAGTVAARGGPGGETRIPTVLLLPGSRVGELNHHLPPMLRAAWLIQRSHPAKFRLVLPDRELAERVRAQLDRVHPGRGAGDRRSEATAVSAGLMEADIQVGHLGEALAGADLAIASTGTVTMECACFGVPTVALYRTSWGTFLIGRQIVLVRYLAMPNLLANEAIYPEFIQHHATAENIARAALEFLDHPELRARVGEKLKRVIDSLGDLGAADRAAQSIVRLLGSA